FMDAAAVFAQTDRELWLITSQAGPRRGGLIATFVSQGSLPPDLPRLLVGIAKHHHTWGLIEAGGAFAAHLIGERHLDWVWRFALPSGRDHDKLAGLDIQTSPLGNPLLGDALAWLDCHVEARLDSGDRTVYLAEVVEARLLSPEPPLTVKRMLALAPADQLRALKEDVLRDSATDAEAIRAWRKNQKGIAP